MRGRKICYVFARKVNLSRRDFLEPTNHAEQRCFSTAAWSKHGNEFAMFYFSVEIDDGVDTARKSLADVGQNDVELRHNDVTVAGLLIQRFRGGKHQAPDRFERYLIDHATLVEFIQQGHGF